MWAVRVFNARRNKQPTEEGTPGRFLHDLHDLHVMNSREMNYWLARFVREVRRQHGKTYSPSTM